MDSSTHRWSAANFEKWAGGYAETYPLGDPNDLYPFVDHAFVCSSVQNWPCATPSGVEYAVLSRSYWPFEKDWPLSGVGYFHLPREPAFWGTEDVGRPIGLYVESVDEGSERLLQAFREIPARELAWVPRKGLTCAVISRGDSAGISSIMRFAHSKETDLWTPA